MKFFGEVYLGVFERNIEVEEDFFRHSGIYDAVLRNVTIGDNCLIENVGNYISGYTIGEESYISNIGTVGDKWCDIRGVQRNIGCSKRRQSPMC